MKTDIVHTISLGSVSLVWSRVFMTLLDGPSQAELKIVLSLLDSAFSGWHTGVGLASGRPFTFSLVDAG